MPSGGRRALRPAPLNLVVLTGVGSRFLVEMTKERLRIKAKGRRVTAQNSPYELREAAAPYRAVFGVKNDLLRLENAYFGDEIQ